MKPFKYYIADNGEVMLRFTRAQSKARRILGPFQTDTKSIRDFAFPIFENFNFFNLILCLFKNIEVLVVVL